MFVCFCVFYVALTADVSFFQKSLFQFMLGIFRHLLQSLILRRCFRLLAELNLMELLSEAARFLAFIKCFYVCFSQLYRSPNFITDTQEAGVFFGFVEFEDMSGIQNALNVSFP